MEDNFQDVLSTLDALLGATNLEDVTADSSNFAEMPDGYYLCEVEKAELKASKSSGSPMVALQYKVVENGVDAIQDKDDISLKEIKGTKNRKIFMNYVLKDDNSVKRFVTDMLKFEGEEKGKPILDKEYFTNSAILEDALEILIGMRIYIQSSTTEKSDGTTSNWKNLISWKRVDALELPL